MDCEVPRGFKALLSLSVPPVQTRAFQKNPPEATKALPWELLSAGQVNLQSFRDAAAEEFLRSIMFKKKSFKLAACVLCHVQESRTRGDARQDLIHTFMGDMDHMNKS